MAKIGRLSIPTLSGGVRSTQEQANRELYRRRGGLAVVPTLADARKNTSQAGTITRNPFLLGPIWRLALRMGGLPIKWYRINGGNGQREEAMDHPGYEITRAPSKKVTRNVLISGTVASMFVHKQGFMLKQRDDTGAIAGLWPIGGNEMEPIGDPRGLVDGFKLKIDPDNPIPFDDVLWFRLMPGFDDWLDSHSPYDSLGKAAQFGGAALDAMIDLFDNGMLGRFYVNLHGKTLEEEVPGTDEETGSNAGAHGFLDRLSVQLSAVRRDKFAAPVAEDGATFDPLGGAPNDEVMIRALELTEKVVTQAFGFPMDGDLKRFYAEAIQPVADAMEQEMERGLATEWPDDPAFPQFQFREVIKGDWREQVEGHARAVLTMLEKPNEGRKDLDLPPVPGGDQLFGPLNLIAVDQLVAGGNRPPKDTQGGLGGGVNDGQDSTVSDQKEPVGAAASATILPFKRTQERASVQANMRTRWDGVRKRVLLANQEAFGRRARATLKKEAQRVRRVVEGRGRSAKARAGDPGLPAVGELLGEVGSADADLQRYLEAFMQNAGEDGWSLAQDLVNAERTSVNQALAASYAERAQVVSSRFAAARAGEMQQLFESAVENGTTMRELANEISASYGRFADNIIDGIGRTETAFAYERAALSAWGEAGITEMDYVNGGGPCTTGVCYEAEGGSPYRIGSSVGDVGYSFEGAQAPPLHPSCTCFVVPSIPEDARGEAIHETPPDALASGIPQGDVEDIRTLGGGVTSTYRGRIGDYNVMLKPQSGLRNEVMRGGIPPAADLSREAAAAIVNEELGFVNMPLVDVRAVNFGPISEESRKFLGLTETEQSVVMEFVDDSVNIMERGGFTALEEEELHRLSLYDAIIGNMDRHGGNGMIGPNGRFWAIDHGLCMPDPVAMLADTRFHGWGNYWAQAETVGQAITEAELDALRSFQAIRDRVSDRLRAAGVEEGAIRGLWGRVERLIADGKLPNVPSKGDAAEWLSASSG